MNGKFLSLILTSALLFTSFAAPAQQSNAPRIVWPKGYDPQEIQSHRPILNGQVDYTYLYFFTPNRVDRLDKLLRENKVKQVAPLLKAEAFKHEEDPSVYVEWLQADHTVWAKRSGASRKILAAKAK